MPGNTDKLFAEARGRRLVLMNDDDVLLPGAAAALGAAFDAAPDVICAYGTLERIGLSGEYDATATEFLRTQSNRTADQAGVHRDMLVRAFWRQVPQVGFMLDTEAARRVGYGEAARTGHAFDIEFPIRLAMTYHGRGAFSCIDDVVAQYRVPAGDGLTSASGRDMVWKLWDLVAGMGGLSAEEALARDWLLAHLAHWAVVENAIGRRRVAALRILLSRHYPRGAGLLRPAYALGLLALPRTTQALQTRSRWPAPEASLWRLPFFQGHRPTSAVSQT